MTLVGHMYPSMLFLFKPLVTLSSLSILLLCLCSHNPSCTQLSTYSAPAPLQLSETRGKHTSEWVMLTHLKFMIMNLKRVLGLILQSLCISLVHSLSCLSRWPFPSCLLLSSQTSSTSFLFLLSMDDFASCFNEKIGAVRRELPEGLISISFLPTFSVHILYLVFCKYTGDLGSYPKPTPPFVHPLGGSNGPSPLAYSRTSLSQFSQFLHHHFFPV